MKKDIYYCIVLPDSQLDFLAGSKYGIDRMKILQCLIDAAVIKETKYEKKGFAITLHIGQAALSEVELATRLGYDKKTVSRLLDRMAELGIVTSEQTNRTSIHTVHCVSAWYADNTTDVSRTEIEKSDTNEAGEFRSGLGTLMVDETSSAVALIDDDGNATTDIEQQTVLSSLISEVSAESGLGEYISLENKQSPPNNHSAEEVQS